MAASSGTEIGRFAGAPVRVSRGFLATTVILYFLTGAYALGWLGLVLWLPLIAGSILVHEAGHALVAKANHQKVTEIALTWHGGHVLRAGLPLPEVDLRVALAGPAASIGLAGVLWMASWLPLGPIAVLLGVGASLNFSWGLLNLIPVPPLDGSRALAALTRKR